LSDAYYLTFLPKAIDLITRQASGLRLDLRSADIGGAPVADELIAGRVDLYLGPPCARSDNLYQRKLVETGFLSIACNEHPLLEETVSVEAFCACPHVLVGTRLPGRSPVDERLEELGQRRRVAVTTRSFMGAGALVAASTMICTLPEQPALTLARLYGLRCFPPPLALPRILICTQWHERTHRDPLHRWLRQQLFAAASIGDPPEAPN
jgi:DNA-binding transcriptional LysR family regulator